MRADRIVDEIRQLRTARYERLGDSTQAWRTDIQAQRLALEAQGWVFAEQPNQIAVKSTSVKPSPSPRKTRNTEPTALRA